MSMNAAIEDFRELEAAVGGIAALHAERAEKAATRVRIERTRHREVTALAKWFGSETGLDAEAIVQRSVAKLTAALAELDRIEVDTVLARRVAATVARLAVQPMPTAPSTRLIVVDKSADDVASAQLAERERRLNLAPADRVLAGAWDTLRHGKPS